MHNFLGNILVRFVCIGDGDTALVDFLDSLDVEFVLGESVLGEAEDLCLLPFWAEVFSALFGVLDLPLQVLDHFPIPSLQQDHLVRDNSHLQERKCLPLSSWESLNNVVGLLRLVLVDNSLEQLNNNLVLHI